MSQTELEKREILRLSNKESNKITKECIQSALILLLKEKEFDKISITDLTKRAGVSRTGYYRNYSSKEDVLRDLLENVVDQIVSAIVSEGNALDQCRTLFEKSKDNAETFALLQKAHFGDSILSEMTNRILSMVSPENRNEKIRQTAICGCVYNLLKIWIENGMKESPEEMAQLYCNLIFSRIYLS